MRSLGSDRRGFSLIEVILAVALLGLGFAVLLAAATRCLAVVRAARLYQEAQWALGRAEAEFPMVMTEDIEDLNVESTTLENGFTFERHVDTEAEEAEGDRKDHLYLVRTRLTWGDRQRPYREELVRYVYWKK